MLTDMEAASGEGSGSGTQYAVRWRARSYVSAVTGALAGLREAELLTDVTLSCEGRRVAAHRVLLAACSPYFRAVFSDNPAPHPVVIFRNVRHCDLLAVVHFMYHGEVSVPHKRLPAFLATAELLQVRGLCGTDGAEALESESQIDPEPEPEPTQPETKRRKLPTRRDMDLDLDPLSRPPLDLLADTSLSHDDLKLQSTDNADDTHLILRPTEMPDNSATSFPENIDICDTEAFQTANILNNLKGTEVPGTQSEPSADITIDGISRETVQDGDVVKFRCQVCWKGFKHPTSLTLHKDSHTGKTQCPVCHRSFSRSYDMRSHLMKIHQEPPATDAKPKTAKPSLGNNT